MRTTIVEAKVGPYSDGSGYREEIKATWQRDPDGKDIVAQVEIVQGDARLVISLAEWDEVRDAVDSVISDTRWPLRMKSTSTP